MVELELDNVHLDVVLLNKFLEPTGITEAKLAEEIGLITNAVNEFICQ